MMTSPGGRRGARRAQIGALVLACGVSLAACGSPEPERLAGSRLYLRHCASCHGADAKGRGPVASSLDVPAPDLTTLARRNGGVFDERRVMQTIDGRSAVAQHGPREMPVWGAVFAVEHVGEPFAIYGPLLDARALADYLRTLQVE